MAVNALDEAGQTGRTRPAGTGMELQSSVQYLRGIGPRVAESLSKLGIHTVEDLLHHIPRRWEDRTRFRHVSELRGGEYATVCGTILSVSVSLPRPKLSIIKVLLDDGGAGITLTWFNQPYLERTFRALADKHTPIVAYGLTRRVGINLEIPTPEWEELGETDLLSMNRIVPIYPSSEGVSQRMLRRSVDEVLRACLQYVPDFLPPTVAVAHHLADIRFALRNIHFPDSFGDREEARRRLVFEEFFLLQTGLGMRRRAHHQVQQGIAFKVEWSALDASLKEILPFQLTGAQRRALTEIAADLSAGHPMNRLLQGDVGSGKTVVALGAMLMAVQNGYQAALMAPTEILAQQHAIVLRNMLEPVGLQVELAIGSQSARVKREAKERILGGQVRIVVGTHALIQEGVQFAKLGLVVIDEQHRFGVLQRQALARKGEQPHVLVMTATPIPRTLTLTLYGDLDATVLDELPPGRKPITTHWKPSSRRAQVYESAIKLLAQGRQVYVVCPLIEQSEKLQAKSAVALRDHLADTVFTEYRVGLLHGQMKSEEKEDVMARFKAQELDVLVSTTVIEVGIDVPNATVMIVEDADRFGLAQLHQLRGRVGRGEHASYCILIADPKTPEGQARMQILTETNDGFRIAEEDLTLRGPGDFCGTRQSGLPDLYIGDIVKDFGILVETRKAAFDLLSRDPDLADPENAALRAALNRSRMVAELVSVG
jgi:ATP-dependent DNA helicase RecG